ncbi:cytochrome c oxidase assembly protein [Ancylobacter radicis]|uniref:Cytochrome c oxidase assembly protein CtaG n=1 Tax=Ancylobacter radicis TaxID=2836179 RepID=A0ABS5RCS5_9HYPH|nr:cytochrome c oxidase assembly protein [Ancylobacter radicis]MBS9478741.1 cytochrome c oxidase assembly protein [Ancylobacter radicis]
MAKDHHTETGEVAPEAPRRARSGANHRIVALSCAAFVATMVGASYAAVPLYQMFCQVTGFGGATKVATAAPEHALERTIEVRFDANVAPGLDWSFAPEVRAVTVRIGETKLAYYRVHNRGSQPVTAAATYNVTPAQSGVHFAKMQCFCFTDQTLQPGESLDMPVIFFVDPALAEDPEMNGLKTITLSYTFFPKAAAPVAAGKPEPGKTPL